MSPRDDVPARDERLARLEAILFLAREPLHPRRISRFANLTDGTEAMTLISRLNRLYALENRSFRVREVAGGWQLRTQPVFASWIRRLQHTQPQLRLSQPSLETLTVIAYRQPVVRATVEAVRGVSCGEVIRQLMERDLVRVVGRSPELGRPFFYGTTKKFLENFGLRDLSDLPRADLFRQSDERGTTSKLDFSIVPGEGDLAVRLSAELCKGLSPQIEEQQLKGSMYETVPGLRAEDEEDEDWDDEELDDDDDDDDWDDEDDDDWDEEDELEDAAEETEDLDDEIEEDEDWDDDEDDEEWEEVDEGDDDDWDEEDEDDEDWDED